LFDPMVRTARASTRAAGFAALTTGMLAGVTLHERAVPRARRAEVFDRHMRLWCRALFRLFGVSVHVAPAPPERARGARLVVANHRSPLDVLVLLSVFGGEFLSAAGIARWPVVGPAARHAGTIFVDRALGGSGARAIRAIRRRLEQGATVIVFPEGTTFVGDEVRPFKLGALAAARDLDIEIVPVGLAYEPGAEWVDETFTAYLARMAGRRRTRVAAHLGEPWRARAPTRELADRLHHLVQDQVRLARKAYDRAECLGSRTSPGQPD
jgi:1-acyl-sn-glycerol-3-phosphate acyltransferase